jgi:hypothetical protein
VTLPGVEVDRVGAAGLWGTDRVEDPVLPPSGRFKKGLLASGAVLKNLRALRSRILVLPGVDQV